MDTSGLRCRTRQSTSATWLRWTKHKTDGSTGEMDYASYAEDIQGSRATMYDEVHPNWRKLIQSGHTVLGRMQLEKWERSYTPGIIVYGEPDGWTYTFQDEVPGYLDYSVSTLWPTVPLVGSQNMSNGCIIKAFGDINSSKICSAESIKDFATTVQMLRSPFKGATSLLGKILKRKKALTKKSGHNVTQAASNAWLEYQYGWKPLLLDMDHIVDFVHEKRNKMQSARRVARSGAQDSGSNRVHCSDVSRSFFKWSGDLVVTKSVRTAVGVLYSVQMRTTDDELGSLLGTRPRDAAPSIWECIPYSFVVDWFVGIGPWLQAVIPDPSVTVLGSWVTTIDTTEKQFSGGTLKYTRTVNYGQGPYVKTDVGSCGSSLVKTTTVTRDLGPSIPPTPILNTAFSKWHTISGAALGYEPLVRLLKSVKS